jgi:hypothetical protein
MDYSSLIEALKEKAFSELFDDVLNSNQGVLSEIVNELNSKPTHKDKNPANTLLFSEFFGEEIGQGLVADFRRKNIHFNLNKKKGADKLGYGDFLEDVTNIMKEYHTQIVAKRKWLGLMGLLERNLLQYECFKDPKIVYGTQKQKSGKNTFEYILLRAPFFDLVKGKDEIRIYYTKMEDYPSYKSIDKLVKNNHEFVFKSKKIVQDKMVNIINSNPISFKEIQSALKEIETETDRKDVEVFEKNRIEYLKKHNFNTNEE